MKELLSLQADYILFCHGLSILVLGAVLYGFVRLDRRSIPWTWVAGFAFCQFVYLWMTMLSLSFESTLLFTNATRCFVGLSFFCLFEFSRSFLKNLKGKTVPVWISILLPLLTFPFVFLGENEFRLAINYLLRFPSFIFLGLTFYHFRKKYYAQSNSLLITNLGFFAYSFWILFFPPIEIEKNSSHLSNLFAAAIAFILSYELEVERLKLLGRISKIKKSVFSFFERYFVLILAAFLIFASYFVFGLGEVKQKQLESDFLLDSQSLVIALDLTKIRSEVLEGGTSNEKRLSTGMTLNDLQDLLGNPPYRAKVFLIKKGVNDQKNYHYPSSATSTGPLFFGLDNVSNVFKSGQAQLLGPYGQSTLQLMSALLPIKHPQSNEIIAVLGIERSVDWLRLGVYRFRLISIFAVGLAIVPLVILWVLQQKNQETDYARMDRVGKLVARQKILLEISNNKAHSLHEFFIAITEKVSLAVPVNRLAIWIFSPDGKRLICKDLFVRNLNEHRKQDDRFVHLFPKYFKSLGHQRSFISDHVEKDDRLSEIYESFLKPYRVHSQMNIPLRSQGRILGVMVYEMTEKFSGWDLEEREFCSSVADLVALAVETYELEKIKKEKKVLEGQILQSSKLLAVGTLASGVAHEINNPLSIIRGYLESNQEKIEQIEDLPRVWDRMLLAVERIDKVVKGLRLYSQSSDETIEECNFYDVINHSLLLLRPLYSQDRISLQWEDNAGRANVRGNPGRLQEVLVSLLSNARDAVCEIDGERRILLVSRLEANTYKLDVIDNGNGIKKDILPRIYDPFFTTKSFSKGAGLGLYITHSILSSCGGAIVIDSAEGKGTIARVELSLHQQTSSGKENFEQRALDSEEKYHTKILIVDDEQDVRDIISEYLDRKGMNVSTARDGQEGLEMVKTHHFDVIVTDIKMPRMKGDKFIEEAKKIPGMKSKFIVMTGGVEWEDEKRAVDLADFQLRKPFEFKEFLRIIQKVSGTKLS